jgi:hypothetical protein
MNKYSMYMLILITLAGFSRDFLAKADREGFFSNEKRPKELRVLHIFEDEVLLAGTKRSLESVKNAGVTILEEYDGDYYVVSSADMKPFDTKAVSVLSKPSVRITKRMPSFEEVKSKRLKVFPLKKSGMKIGQTNKTIDIIDRSKDKHPDLENMIAMIDRDSLESYIQKLEDMQTRYFYAENRREVAVWIRDKFIETGCETAYLDSFFMPAFSNWMGSFGDSWQYNVVAEIPGVSNNEEIVIIGGHHDSISMQSGEDPMVYAPGADDNGTAVATALEIARVYSIYGFTPRNRIKFVTFAAEELGLVGSYSYAERAYNSGMNIKAMINIDMTGFTTQNDMNGAPIYINSYTSAPGLAQTAADGVENFSPLSHRLGSENWAGSDSYPFHYYGFPAVWFFEYDFSPYYHSYQDLLSNMKPAYFHESVKAVMATGFMVTEIPSAPSELTLKNKGDGSSLYAQWRSVKDSDLISYRVYTGLSSGDYESFMTVTDTTYTVSGLIEGETYFVAVSSVVENGTESPVIESSEKISSVPAVPAGLFAEPVKMGVELKWDENIELDLAGYKLYRNSGNGYLQVVSLPFSTTEYTDTEAVAGVENIYYITAYDADGNESSASEEVFATPPSFDRGILVVNESINGSGTLTDPNLQMIDDHFALLLESFRHEIYYPEYDIPVTLNKLGLYSVILWQCRTAPYSPSLLKDNIGEIKKYLDMGGNMIVNSDKAGLLIENNMSYPYNCTEESPAYKYFGLDSLFSSSLTRFSGAESASGFFGDIILDTTKVSPSNGDYFLRGIEVFAPVDYTDVIYTFGSDYDPLTNAGMYKGKPVGIMNITDNYKTALLNFYLYYADPDRGKNFIETLLTDFFNEPVGINDENISNLPGEIELLKNYPNPFNPETNIRFRLRRDSRIRLSVFDVTGREVAVISEGNLSKGDHQFRYDGSLLSAGIYFYRLATPNSSITRKFALIK